MTAPQLKPCPFCGGRAALVIPATGRPFVCCDVNFCNGPQGSADEAINAWNARADLNGDAK